MIIVHELYIVFRVWVSPTPVLVSSLSLNISGNIGASYYNYYYYYHNVTLFNKYIYLNFLLINQSVCSHIGLTFMFTSHSSSNVITYNKNKELNNGSYLYHKINIKPPKEETKQKSTPIWDLWPTCRLIYTF